MDTSRSGLPNAEMKTIWLLVDINQRRTGLNFAEFACAMYIAFRRAKQSAPLPAELPSVLRAIVTSGITSASQAGMLVEPSRPPDSVAPAVAQLASTEACAPAADEPPQQDVREAERPNASSDTSKALLQEQNAKVTDRSESQDTSGPGDSTVSPSLRLQEVLKVMEQEVPPAAANEETSQQSASAIPVFFESSDLVSQDPFDEAMSVKELKARLTALGADYTGLAEKSELLAMLKRVETSRAKPSSPMMGIAQAPQVVHITPPAAVETPESAKMMDAQEVATTEAEAAEGVPTDSPVEAPAEDDPFADLIPETQMGCA